MSHKQAEAQGNRASDVFSEVTHETRRPLGLARSYLSLILDEQLGPLSGPLRARLEQIDAKLGEAQSALDNRLLLLSTLERNERQRASQESVDVLAAVQGAINRAQVRRELAGGRLEFQHPPPPISARANSALLSRVLDNLLENALIYAVEPPQVTVEVGVGVGVGDRPFVMVVDQGVGMTPAVATDIFEKGFRGEFATLRPGSGLGLWLSRRAAEQMEARLVLESTAPGKGSAFLLELQPDQDVSG